MTNTFTNSVTELNDSGSLVQVQSAAGEFSNPTGIAFDGHRMWVTNSGSNSITPISAS